MQEVRFEVEGEPVVGDLHEPQGEAQGQLVLVHGFLSQRKEFADAPAALAAKGWRTLALDQRGWGGSGGERGRVSVARAKADVLGAVRLLREARPDLPVGLVGHSMGACFALHALVEDPDVRAAVLCAPMATVRAEMATLEFGGYRALGRVSALAARVGLGHLSVPYKYSEKHLFRDPEAARRAKEAGFLTRKVSFANYDDLLAMDATLPASEARRPVLVILAQHDRAVKHASSRAVYDALVGPKELVTVPTGHSMFGDRDGALAVREVDRWMRRHLAKGSA